MTTRENLRTALNPKSVAIVGASDNPNKIGGARGPVSGAAARLREARHAPTTRVSGGPDCGSVGARGPVSGAAARLREARLRTPGYGVRCASGACVAEAFA